MSKGTIYILIIKLVLPSALQEHMEQILSARLVLNLAQLAILWDVYLAKDICLCFTSTHAD